jgi:hypothetical protein
MLSLDHTQKKLMNLNSNPEQLPVPPFYDVGDKVARTGFVYQITELPDNTGKYFLRKLYLDGTLDKSDTKIYRFTARQLHPFG